MAQRELGSNNGKYDIKLTEIKETTKSFTRTLNLHRKDNKPLEIKEIKKIFDKYIPANTKCVMRGLNSMQWFTIKSLSENDLNVKDYQDYYQGKVIDPTKFDKFFQLSISVIQPK